MRQDTRYILAGLAALGMVCSTIIAGIQSTVPHDLIAVATGIVGILVGERVGTYAERARHPPNGGPVDAPPPK